MKSKCKHGFDVACLMCGFGEFEGKRVWFDWAWQEQQKRIEELESKVTDLNKNLKDRELAVLVRQEKIEAALKIIQEMKDMRWFFPAHELEQALKGDMNEQHINR